MKPSFQYRLGYAIGRWQEIRKRLNWQFLLGYMSGYFGRIFSGDQQ